MDQVLSDEGGRRRLPVQEGEATSCLFLHTASLGISVPDGASDWWTLKSCVYILAAKQAEKCWLCFYISSVLEKKIQNVKCVQGVVKILGCGEGQISPRAGGGE